MHFVQLKTTELFAPVHQDTDLTQIHTLDANSMSVWPIQNAPQHLLVKMKNVQILANVPEMLIVLQGTTEESVLASQDILEILMV